MHSAHQPPLHTRMRDLGRRIETYRISRRIKQEELADLAGLSRVTLGKLEAGKGATLDSLLRVLRALGLDDRILNLVPDAGISPLDPMAAQGQARQRVRDTGPKATTEPWQWGDEQPGQDRKP